VRIAPRALAVALAALAMWALPAASVTAHALPIIDAAMAASNALLMNIINDMTTEFFNGATYFIQYITPHTALTAPFEDLFGTGVTSPMYQLSRSISTGVIRPMAQSLLGLVVLLQMVKICKRSEGNEVLPGVRDIVFLLVTYGLLSFLVHFAADVMALAYTAVLALTERIQDVIGAQSTYSFTIVHSAVPHEAAGKAMMLLVVAVLFYITSMLAFLVTLVISYARAVQLYVMAAFSPIPFALLGFEETKGWGVGYLKTFLSVCLAGAVMVMLLLCYPLILSNILGQSGWAMSVVTGSIMIDVFKVLAVSLLLVFALIKSGAWARDILGG
jgi:hypothetical protein